jgi:hypothetical protein
MDRINKREALASAIAAVESTAVSLNARLELIFYGDTDKRLYLAIVDRGGLYSSKLTESLRRAAERLISARAAPGKRQAVDIVWATRRFCA